MGQSSNDVFPTAVHIAAAEALERDLIPALEALQGALAAKAKPFDHVVKIGRTHLMDAVPVRLGQEFSGYAQIADQHRPPRARRGAVGVGAGAGRHRRRHRAELGARVRARRSSASSREEIGVPLRQAPNLFEALSARDGLVEASGALRSAAASLTKIANDIRWLGSGPRCGIGEILLPDLQPGSSIMPGKVNPVMSRDAADGLRAGHRQRRDHRLGRRGRQLRAERHDPGDGVQPAALDRHPRRRVRGCSRRAAWRGSSRTTSAARR